jgi:stage III sporulation protein AG
MSKWSDTFKRFKDYLNAKDKKTPLYLIMLLLLGASLMLLGGWPVLTGMDAGRRDADTGNTADTGSIPDNGETIPAFASQESGGSLFTRERGLEKRLEEAFTLVENVGEVRVIVSLSREKETVYAADKDITESQSREEDAQGGTRANSSRSSKEETIIITDGTGTDRPLVLREIEPSIAGVVIIAEGGDSVFVQDALTRAACVALDVEANKVQVLTMKKGE